MAPINRSGHFDPAVTFGSWAGGRFRPRDIPGHVVAQVAGAIVSGWLHGGVLEAGIEPNTARRL